MKSSPAKKTKLKSALTAQLATYSATATGLLLVVPVAQGAIQTISSSTITLAPAADGVNHLQSLNLGVFHGAMSVEHGDFYYKSARSYRRGGGAGLQGGFLVFSAGNIVKPVFGGHIVGGNFSGGTSGHLVAHRFTSVTNSGTGRSAGGRFFPNRASRNVTGYVGFKTHQNSQDYYGWLRVQVHADAQDRPDKISILTDANGYVGAYGLASDGITAGQIAPAPEPGTLAIGGLGLLALGARGVRELRRRRVTAAKN